MATQLVTLRSLLPVLCTSNLPLSPGDLVQLALDVAADPGLPSQIEGVVQTPIERAKMLDENQCIAVGYVYTVAYESDDLEGAVALLTEDLVISFGCITCCEKNDQNIATERDERIAANAALFKTTSFESSAAGVTTVVLPAGCKHLVVRGNFTGIAGTRTIVLDTTNAVSGAHIELLADLPAVASVVLDIRNAASGGTQLDTITTDASGRDAGFTFNFTTAWNRGITQYPN